MRTRHLVTLGAAAAAVALLAAAPKAHACGGFFCNRQAIDQSGENIAFIYNDDGTVTTVVQILYQGPSEEFAWILPIPAEPTVDVGTDVLFQRLAASTSPRFTTRTEVHGTCRAEPSCDGWWDDRFDSDGPMAGGGFADAGAAPPPSGEVDVRFRGNVGPFDVAVLRSGDADALRTWLTDNGYEIPESAGAEMDHYVALDHFFVALKLLKNRETGEIQPIVLTSANDEPCIPIRLTRIATVPNMPITAYFLGDQRVRPLNFMLVEPDLDDFGLWTGGTRYFDAVTRAVDDAGGHAFVTDFAGDMPSLSIELQSIEHLRTETDPGAFLRELRDRGFVGDSQLLGILTRNLPPPDGFDAQTFYNSLFQGWGQDDPQIRAHLEAIGFDPDRLVDDLNAGIVDPRARAQGWVDARPHLTRLFTTMSADEMDEDPMFMRSDELAPAYSNVHEATQHIDCGPEFFQWTAPVRLELPSGREQLMREGVPYHGDDDAYCEDRYGGDFRPGMPTDRLREVSDERGFTPGGGAACSASPVSTGFGALFLVGAAGAALAWRRRKA